MSVQEKTKKSSNGTFILGSLAALVLAGAAFIAGKASTKEGRKDLQKTTDQLKEGAEVVGKNIEAKAEDLADEGLKEVKDKLSKK